MLLDENLMAEGQEFFEVGNLAVSPDHGWLAFATDTTGGEVFDLAFRWVGGGPPAVTAPEVIGGTYYGLAWANDERTVFYTRVDEAMRPYQLWRHRLGDDPAGRHPGPRGGRRALHPGGGADQGRPLRRGGPASPITTSELWVIPADRPEAAPRVIEHRRPGVEYTVEHHAGRPGGPRAGSPW